MMLTPEVIVSHHRPWSHSGNLRGGGSWVSVQRVWVALPSLMDGTHRMRWAVGGAWDWKPGRWEYRQVLAVGLSSRWSHCQIPEYV